MIPLTYRIPLCLFILVTCQYANGQVKVNCSKPKKEDAWSKPLRAEDYQKLKNSTLYFVLPASMTDEQDDYQSVLDSVWSYSDIAVIGMNELGEYISNNDAAFLVLSYSVSDLDGFKSVESVYLELMKVRDQTKKLDSKNLIEYAKIELVPDCETQIKMFEGWVVRQQKPVSEFEDHINSKTVFANFKPGIMANYLKFVQSELNEKKCSGLVNKGKLNELKNDTLYFTQNVIVKFENINKKTDRCKSKKSDVKALFKNYPYTYQLISFDDLNEKILEGGRFFYAICNDQNYAFEIFYNTTGENIYSWEREKASRESWFIPQDLKPLINLLGK